MTLHKFADADTSVAERQFSRPLPSYMPPQGKPFGSDVHIISSFDEDLDFFNPGHNMADTDMSMPHIKREPDDFTNDPNQYMSPGGYTIPAQQFGQFPNQRGNDGIDPSELTMQNGSYDFNSYGGSQTNLPSSFNMGGGAGIQDDELLDLDLNDPQGGQNMQANMPNYYSSQQPSGISMSHQGQMTNVYSHTPEGAPIQSPYTHDFDYTQYRPMGGQQQFSQQNSSHPGSGQFSNNYMRNPKARQLQTSLERKSSDPRSPHTPKTPAMGALTLGSPESGSFPSQPIRAPLHNKQLSGAWNSPNSPYVDSPLSSPGNPSHHNPSMSEILRTPKHASLPNTSTSKSSSQDESQEAKRKRRRASHNLVERRRRDNINERIQDLSHLVPQHRLEDDKVKKHLSNNSPISPTLGATSLSPPHATSLLAGGTGRRATAGNITMGIPMEDKEKGPNKGDILNGSVSWTRDLMWALHMKIQQESELKEYVHTLGGHWPFEQTEDEKRMQTELLDAIQNNDPPSFQYSRRHGSGLRVPKHTTVAGDPIGQGTGTGTLSPQSLSPAFHSGGSGTNSGGQNQAQFWGGSGHAGISFKEEDEYNMDLE